MCFPLSKDMAFINNKKDIRALRDIGGNRPILITEDDNFFYVTNDVTVTTLKKYRGTIRQIPIPVLSKKDQIGEAIAIDDTESLVNAVKSSKYVGLFLYDQQLHGFITSNSGLSTLRSRIMPRCYRKKNRTVLLNPIRFLIYAVPKRI